MALFPALPRCDPKALLKRLIAAAASRKARGEIKRGVAPSSQCRTVLAMT